MAGGELLYEAWQELSLVDHGRTDVDIKNGGTCGHLLVRKAQSKGKVVGLELSNERFFARWIDALTNDAERLMTAHTHKVRTRGQNDAACRNIGPACKIRLWHGFHMGTQGRDMVWRRATTTAQKLRTHGRKGHSLFSKGLWWQAEAGFAINEFWQASIRLHKNRHSGVREQFRHHAVHLLRTCTAIGTERVHAKVEHGLNKNTRRTTREADALFKGHGHHDR